MNTPAKANLHPPTGADLWDRYFTVRMHYLRSRSVEHVRRYGARVSGNPEIDRLLPNQEIITQLNIDAMFEKFRTGVTIRVVNYDDTAEIYRIIHHHLVAWAEYMTRGVNVAAAPLKDLIELDMFAEAVYDKARSVFSNEVRQSALSNNFRNIQQINFHNILQRANTRQEVRRTSSGAEVTEVQNGAAANKALPVRPSMKDLFVREADAMGQWRESEG